MYGAGDIYNSPAVEEFGEDSDLAEIDAYLDEDDEDDDEGGDAEFGAILGIGKGGGILGIAISDKAKRNKMNRLLGNLKSYYEMGKQDKARRYAKALGRIDPIKKQKEGWITPEVQAWLDYAETGDWDALGEALSALDWAGDEDESPDDQVEGDVSTADGSSRPYRGRRKHLPPGFRPRGYSTWGPLRKRHWLKHHPNAASILLPGDPGYHGGGHPAVRAAYRAGHRAPPPPAPVHHPWMRAAYRAGRASSPAPAPAPRVAAPVSRPAPYSPGHPFVNAAYRAGSHSQPGFPGMRSAFRAGRSGRYGEEADETVSGHHPFMRGAHAAGSASTRGEPGHKYVRGSFRAGRAGYGLDEAIEEGVEEFGAGLIGANAFVPLQGHDALDHDVLLEDDIDDDAEGIDGIDADDLDEDDDEHMGAYVPQFGAYVPQFGALFKRDIEDRLEAARRRYQYLVRTADMTDPVQEGEVIKAKEYYEKMVRAVARASEMPEAPGKGRALRRQIMAEEQHPGMAEVSLFSAHDEDDDVDEVEEDLRNMGISMGKPRAQV